MGAKELFQYRYVMQHWYVPVNLIGSYDFHKHGQNAELVRKKSVNKHRMYHYLTEIQFWGGGGEIFISPR